jgi:hypothetical protein
LVPPNYAQAIAKALDDAIARLATRPFDTRTLKRLYEERFSDSVAHGQWLGALRLA